MWFLSRSRWEAHQALEAADVVPTQGEGDRYTYFFRGFEGKEQQYVGKEEGQKAGVVHSSYVYVLCNILCNTIPACIYPAGQE